MPGDHVGPLRELYHGFVSALHDVGGGKKVNSELLAISLDLPKLQFIEEHLAA